MKNYWILIVLIISFASCKTIKTVPLNNETTIHERLVAVAVPQDSASIEIQFTVEAQPRKSIDTSFQWWNLIPNPVPLSKIAISDYSEVKSKNVETSFKVKDNKVSMSFKTTRDTVYIPVSDTLRKKEVPVYITKEVKVKQKLNWFQRTFMYSGIGFWLLLIIIIIIKIIIKFK